jgi:hypothetical protein
MAELEEVIARTFRSPADREADVIRRGGSMDPYTRADPDDATWPPSTGAWPW